jgi:hypothetical protein
VRRAETWAWPAPRGPADVLHMSRPLTVDTRQLGVGARRPRRRGLAVEGLTKPSWREGRAAVRRVSFSVPAGTITTCWARRVGQVHHAAIDRGPGECPTPGGW